VSQLVLGGIQQLGRKVDALEPITVRSYPLDPYAWDEDRETILIADDAGAFGRQNNIATDYDITFHGRPTVRFSGPSPYSNYFLPDPIDMTQYDYLEVWVWVDEGMQPNGQDVYLIDQPSAPFLYADSYRVPLWATMWQRGNGDLSAGWKRVRVSRHEWEKRGSNPVDLTQINTLHFMFSAGSGGTINFRLAQIDGVRVRRGQVLIDFDDGHNTDYTMGFPILRKYGLRATSYVITSIIGQSPNAMTVSQLLELRDAGWTIGSHTHDHHDLRTLTPEEVRYQLAASQNRLKSWGLVPGCYFLATPFGTWSQDIRAIAEQFYISARIDWTGPPLASPYDSIPPEDNYTWRFLSVTPEVHSAEDIMGVVDDVIARKQRISILWHRLREGGDSAQQGNDIVKFEAINEYIAEKRDNGLLDVLTAEEAFLQQRGIVVPGLDRDVMLGVHERRNIIMELTRAPL